MNDADYFDIWLERFGGWTLITLFCAIPVIFMLFIPDFWGVGWYGTASCIGKIAGVIGFILYAINMLLSVRRRWLERFFNGLNRVYIAHHLTGGIALILLAFHPVFLAVRYIELSSLATIKMAAEALLFKSSTFAAAAAATSFSSLPNSFSPAFLIKLNKPMVSTPDN